MSDERDTVPAPPVPSENATATMREKLEGDMYERRVAIMQPSPQTNPALWRGIIIRDGVAEFYTPELEADEAHEWLSVARRKARDPFSWIPKICTRCFSPMTTPSICERCLKP